MFIEPTSVKSIVPATSSKILSLRQTVTESLKHTSAVVRDNLAIEWPKTLSLFTRPW